MCSPAPSSCAKLSLKKNKEREKKFILWSVFIAYFLKATLVLKEHASNLHSYVGILVESVKKNWNKRTYPFPVCKIRIAAGELVVLSQKWWSRNKLTSGSIRYHKSPLDSTKCFIQLFSICSGALCDLQTLKGYIQWNTELAELSGTSRALIFMLVWFGTVVVTSVQAVGWVYIVLMRKILVPCVAFLNVQGSHDCS